MNRTPAAIAAGTELARELGQAPLDGISDADFWRPARDDGGDFVVWGKPNKHRPRRRYVMVYTPEGYAVHQGEGCESEGFRGPLGCWHSKEYSVTGEEIEDMTNNNTAVTVSNPTMALVPSRIEFTDVQLQTIADVICVDDQGNRAPEAFVQLFLGVCRHTGLDPFLRQIYALCIRGKWTAFTGIDGYRVISERTGLDQGMDGPQWSDDGKEWFDFPPSEGSANYCRVGIWRKGVPRAYVTVLSLTSRIQAASNSWKNDPNGMLAKCCESLARRRAFPADMAMLGDTRFDVEDADGVPMTRAEVPEAAWRDVEAPELATPVSQAELERLADKAGFNRPQEEDAPEPGPAQDNPAFDEDGTADVPLATDEQLAKVTEWTEALKTQGKAATDAVDAARRAEWPYAIVAGRFSAAKLTEAHCADYIAVLADAAGGAATEAQPGLAGVT